MLSGLENPLHLLILLLLVLLLFGARRLPEIGRSLGTGMREFKESVTGRSADTRRAAAPDHLGQAIDASKDDEPSS
jgi:sec-independent protein translocase protein TatA